MLRKTTGAIFQFNKIALLATLALFCGEIIIALFIHDNIVRPYVGDALVAVLIYCFLRSFLRIRPLTLAIIALLFCYTVEVLQFLNIVNIIGLGESRFARILIGTSFSWMDILAYTIGVGAAFSVDYSIMRNSVRRFSPRRAVNEK